MTKIVPIKNKPRTKKSFGKQIKANEKDFRDLLDEISNGIVIYIDSKMCYTNQAFAEIFGYKKEELIGTKLDFFTSKIKGVTLLIDQIRAQLSQNDTSSVYQAIGTGKDGKIIDIEVSINKTTFNGKLALRAIVKDISKQKSIEKDLYESEEQYKSVVELANDGIAIIQESLVQYVNSRISDILGYTPDAIVGTPFVNYIHPQEVEKTEDRYKNLMENEDSFSLYETILIHKNGNPVNVEISSRLIAYKGKTADLIVIRNITERKKVAQALAEKDELYKILIEHASDAFAIINPDGTTRYQSASMKKILGYSIVSTEHFTKSITEFIHPDDITMVIETFGRLLEQSGATAQIEVRIKHANGTWLTMDVFARNLTDNPIIRGIVANYRDISERKKVEEELIHKEEHYRALIENTLDATLMLDADGNILYASPSYTRILGFDCEYAKGINFFNHIERDDISKMTDFWIQLKANLWSTVVFQLRAQHKDGSLLHIEIYGHNLLDHPALKAIVINFRDITDRNEAEQELINQEKYFRTIIENSTDGISILNADGISLYESPAARRQLGYTPQELEDKHYFDLVHPDDIQVVSEIFADLVHKPGGIEHDQMRCLHKDGTWHTLEVTSKNLLNDPIINGIVNNIRDITDRKRAEQALEHRTKQILAIQKVNTSIISTLELKEVLQLIAEAAVTNMGFNHSLIFLHDDAANVNRGTVFHTEEDEEFVKHLEEMLGLSLISIEVPIIRGINVVVDDSLDRKETILHDVYSMAGMLFTREQCDAAQKHLRVKIIVNVPFLTKDKFVGSLMVFSDKEKISDVDMEALWLLANQAAIAIENAKFNEELEQRVNERTRQLKATNKELESFAYSVSHDLRAPLRSIDGFSQIILEDYANSLDNHGKEYLHRICAAVKRMTQLIDGILDLSRTTRGEFNRERINLSEIAESISKELKEQQPEREVEFSITPHLMVNGDARLLRAALENLIRNSWKFTGKHESAHIEIGYTEHHGNPVYFVRDDGAGFDMANAEKLFGTFQRLHGPDEFEGTGIGLATVQRIINRHGGDVWAESSIEKGATFYFTL